MKFEERRWKDWHSDEPRVTFREWLEEEKSRFFGWPLCLTLFAFGLMGWVVAFDFASQLEDAVEAHSRAVEVRELETKGLSDGTD